MYFCECKYLYHPLHVVLNKKLWKKNRNFWHQYKTYYKFVVCIALLYAIHSYSMYEALTCTYTRMLEQYCHEKVLLSLTKETRIQWKNTYMNSCNVRCTSANKKELSHPRTMHKSSFSLEMILLYYTQKKEDNGHILTR